MKWYLSAQEDTTPSPPLPLPFPTPPHFSITFTHKREGDIYVEAIFAANHLHLDCYTQ